MRRRVMGGSSASQYIALVAPADFNPDAQELNILTKFDSYSNANKRYIFSVANNATTTSISIGTSRHYGEYVGGILNEYDTTSSSITWTAGSTKRFVIVCSTNTSLPAISSYNAFWLYTGNCPSIGSHNNNTSIKYVHSNKLLISTDDNALSGCTALTGNIVIPDSVTTIGTTLFINCTGLNGSLKIPSSVTSIGYGLIANSNISSITIEGSNFKVVDNVIYNYTGTRCIGSSKYKSGTLSLPASLTSVDTYAFYLCTNITGSLTIPSTVTTIGNGAFQNCSGFTGNLVIPNSVTSLGDNAFNGCNKMTGTLTLSSNLTYLGVSCFQSCLFTGNVNIPGSVQIIQDYCFLYNYNLTSVTFNSGLLVIGKSSFSDCTGITGQIVLPNTLTTIRSYGLRNLSSCTYGINIPASVTYISENPFSGSMYSSITVDGGSNNYVAVGNIVYTKDMTRVIGTSKACMPTDIVIPNSITVIGSQAFMNATTVNSITFGASLTTIEMSAFGFNIGPAIVELPSTLTTVGDYVFYNGSGTSRFIMPASLTSVGSLSFSRVGVTRIDALKITPISIQSNTFNDVNKNACVVHVPVGSLSAYRANTYWNQFVNIIADL